VCWVPASDRLPIVASGDLYSLLGVDPGIGNDGLRRAYETEVSRAAKAGYQRRVLDLSNALDALPRGRGGMLYPSTQTRADRVGLGAAYDRRQSWEPSQRAASAPARSGQRRSKQPGSRFLTGLIVGFLTTSLVAIGAYVYLTKTPPLEAGTPPGVRVVSRVVPPNQVTDPKGFVHVICQPAPGAAGYSFRARRGQTVTCNNGATPFF